MLFVFVCARVSRTDGRESERTNEMRRFGSVNTPDNCLFFLTLFCLFMLPLSHTFSLFFFLSIAVVDDDDVQTTRLTDLLNALGCAGTHEHIQST